MVSSLIIIHLIQKFQWKQLSGDDVFWANEVFSDFESYGGAVVEGGHSKRYQ